MLHWRQIGVALAGDVEAVAGGAASLRPARERGANEGAGKDLEETGS